MISDPFGKALDNSERLFGGSIDRLPGMCQFVGRYRLEQCAWQYLLYEDILVFTDTPEKTQQMLRLLLHRGFSGASRGVLLVQYRQFRTFYNMQFWQQRNVQLQLMLEQRARLLVELLRFLCGSNGSTVAGSATIGIPTPFAYSFPLVAERRTTDIAARTSGDTALTIGCRRVTNDRIFLENGNTTARANPQFLKTGRTDLLTAHGY